MTTHDEIVNKIFKNMEERGYSPSRESSNYDLVINPPTIDLKSMIAFNTVKEIEDFQQFLDDVLEVRFGETGEPE